MVIEAVRVWEQQNYCGLVVVVEVVVVVVVVWEAAEVALFFILFSMKVLRDESMESIWH